MEDGVSRERGRVDRYGDRAWGMGVGWGRGEGGYRMGDWYRARASPNPIPHVNGLTDRCKNINFGILQNAVDNNGSFTLLDSNDDSASESKCVSMEKNRIGTGIGKKNGC